MSTQGNINDSHLIISPKIKESSKIACEGFFSDKPRLIRLSIVIILITLFGLANNLGFGNHQPIDKSTCLVDATFVATKSINETFISNKYFRNTIYIIGSILIDLLFLFSLFKWALFSDSWRYGLTLMLFYGFRFIVQQTFQFGYPEGFIWEDPGMPSIVVGYMKTNDFFFSGHVGLPTITAFELKWEKKYAISALSFCITLFETFLVIISRVHFNIDVIVGVLFSHYCLILVEYFLQKFRILYKKYVKRKEKRNMDIENDEPNFVKTN